VRTSIGIMTLIALALSVTAAGAESKDKASTQAKGCPPPDAFGQCVMRELGATRDPVTCKYRWNAPASQTADRCRALKK
jgi:hypothetical protein